MGINPFGFATPDSVSGPQLSQPVGLSIGATVQLPNIAEERLSTLQAYRLLATGQFREVLSDARAGISGFHRRIAESYNKSWEQIKGSEGLKGVYRRGIRTPL